MTGIAKNNKKDLIPKNIKKIPVLLKSSTIILPIPLNTLPKNHTTIVTTDLKMGFIPWIPLRDN